MSGYLLILLSASFVFRLRSLVHMITEQKFWYCCDAEYFFSNFEENFWKIRNN